MEHRPGDDDFYSFDWSTIHPQPLHESHLVEQLMDLEDKSSKKKQEPATASPKTKKETSEANKKVDVKPVKPKKNAFFDDGDEYPVYPNEAHIFMDVKNGFDIYYDPHYEPAHDYSHYDRMYLGEDFRSSGEAWDDGFRSNETPMYVRPYLEDPVWLEPDDDEIALLHKKKTAAKH